MTRVILSPQAETDLSDITDHYLAEAGVEVTVSFLTSWTQVMQHLEQFPESGALRFADAAHLPGLRFWPMRGFPHLALYPVAADGVQILRVLHSARDIPQSLRP
jgi:toxin ParE1/3/4